MINPRDHVGKCQRTQVYETKHPDNWNARRFRGVGSDCHENTQLIPHATYLRSIDPYHHPLTCHTGKGRQVAKDDIPVIDFDMVGGNHDERIAVAPQTLAIVSSAYSTKPPMPVLVGETCYEGHMQQGFGDVQRRMFWGSILSGAAGHTYGAAGIWHAGVENDPGNWGAWNR